MISHTFIACAVAIAVTWIAAVTPADDDSSSVDAQIRELLTQKRDVLNERFIATEQRYKLGTIQHDRVLNAQQDLLSAELELATSQSDRIAVLERKLQVARSIEKLVVSRFNDGSGQLDAALVAKADRLDAEIALLREKAEPSRD